MAKARPIQTDRRRSAGVLLHVTSLPGPYGIGDLGPAAFRWVDALARARRDTTGCSRCLFLMKGHAQGTHRNDRAATHNCREHRDPSRPDLLIRLHG